MILGSFANVSFAEEAETYAQTVKGDYDGNGTLDENDASYLLMHCWFPDSYPIDKTADLDKNGVEDENDASYLLMHCWFPESYPIEEDVTVPTEPKPANSFYVTFMLNDGTPGSYAMQVVEKDEFAKEPDAPSRMCYKFDGWYTEPENICEYDFSQAIKNDITLYAKWNPIDENSTETTASGGSTIFSITNIFVSELCVTATVNVNASSVLLIRFLDENTKTLLTQISTHTPAYAESAEITIPLNYDLPNYFIVSADLFDNDGNKMCDTFTSIEYTSKHEIFENKTIYDFDEDQIIVNFDKQIDDNFGVLADGIIVINQSDKVNKLTTVDPSLFTDEELEGEFEQWYYFTGSDDQVRNLAIGDKILATDTDGQQQLFKIGEIVDYDDGEYLLKPSNDVQITDFYSFIKADISTQTADSDVQSEEITEIEQYNNAQTYTDTSIDDSDTSFDRTYWSIDFKPGEALDIVFEFESLNTVYFSMKYDIELWGENYFYLKYIATSDATGNVDIKVSGDVLEDEKKGQEKKSAKKVLFPTQIPSLFLFVQPSYALDFKVSNAGHFVYHAKTVSGFIYDSYYGRQDIGKEEKSFDIGLEGAITFDLSGRLDFGLTWTFVSASIYASFGVIIAAEVESDYNVSINSDSIHACYSCLSGSLQWYLSAGVSLKIKLIKKENAELEVFKIELYRIQEPIKWPPFGDGSDDPLFQSKLYWSLSNPTDSLFAGKKHIGMGECPNKKWRVGFKVLNNDGSVMDNVPVLIYKDNQFVKQCNSSENVYLSMGIYEARVEINGRIESETIYVVDEAQDIEISALPDEGESAGVIYRLNDDKASYSAVGLADENFTEITILDSYYGGLPVTSIGNNAFEDCTGLTSVIIGKNVTTIGDSAFEDCFYLTSVKIPNSVITIGNNAFYRCNYLPSVTIPDSVATIGDSAFWACTSLTSIIIPDSVTTIENSAFAGCIYLTNIAVDEKNPVYHSAGNCIIETGSKTLITGCKNSIIPNDGSVTIIGDYAFADCRLLTSITIPYNVTKIGDWAFKCCTKLMNVTISSNVSVIGYAAFFTCISLTSITIPDSVSQIEGSAFSACTGLTSVVFENTDDWFADRTAVNVTDPSMNATNLTDTYRSYTWIRKG